VPYSNPSEKAAVRHCTCQPAPLLPRRTTWKTNGSMATNGVPIPNDGKVIDYSIPGVASDRQ
jgi:hypothetical protein